MTRSILSLPDLDEEDRAVESGADVVEKTYGQDELDALVAAAVERAREEAWAEGIEAGKAEAMSGIQARVAASLEELGPRIQELSDRQAAYCDDLEEEMVRFMAGLCEKLFPEMARAFTKDRINAELKHIARRAIGSPWLEIRLPPGAGDAARSMASPDGGEMKVLIVEDERLDGAAVEARWKNGRSSYCFASMTEEILSLLKGARTKETQENQDCET